MSISRRSLFALTAGAVVAPAAVAAKADDVRHLVNVDKLKVLTTGAEWRPLNRSGTSFIRWMTAEEMREHDAVADFRINRPSKWPS